MSSYPSPEAAESAFYTALENADLNTMMAVWDTHEDIVCIHPLGSRLQGPAQVRQSWRQIFNSGTQLRFRVSAIHTVSEENLVVRMVYENITVLGVEEQPTQPIIATNVYRKGTQGWRMILHHASPGPSQRDGGAILH